MNDTQAISAVLGGDKDRFRELVERHKNMVYAITWSQLGNTDLSEDASQETFVKAYRYLRALRDPSRFGYWLARIARNVCWKYRQRASRELAFVRDISVLESQAVYSGNRDELEAQLWLSFAALPNNHREALSVFYLEGKSVAETSAILGISESATKTRLHRARLALREQLDRKMEEALESLRPSERFTGSVMALLPVAPNFVLGIGGLAGVLGKLTASLSFLLWLVVAQTALFSGLMWLFSKLEATSIRDTPENAFRKVQIRRAAIDVVVFMIPSMLVVALLVHQLAPHRFYEVLCVFSLAILWSVLRQLRVNRSPFVWGRLFTILGISLPCVAIGFLHAPNYVMIVSLMAVSVVQQFSSSNAPRRYDYNLFLRYVTGGLGTVAGELAPIGRLTDLELRGFIQFLGGQWLIKDYSLAGDTLVLVLPEVRRTPAVIVGLARSSQIVVTRTGDCTPIFSASDRKAIEQLTSRTVTEDVPQRTCHALRQALILFVQGDLAGAQSTLSSSSIDAIVDQKAVGRNNRIFLAIAASCGLYVLYMSAIVLPRMQATVAACRALVINPPMSLPSVAFSSDKADLLMMRRSDAAVSGAIVYDNGRPASGVKVIAEMTNVAYERLFGSYRGPVSARFASVMGQSTVTGADGTYRIAGLTSLPYAIRLIDPNDGAMTTIAPDITPPARTTIPVARFVIRTEDASGRF